MADASGYYDKIRSVTEFTVTEEHLKLLRCLYVSWDHCEFCVLRLISKRPYGNSDVIEDIREILGYPEEHYRDPVTEYYYEIVADNFTKLHR